MLAAKYRLGGHYYIQRAKAKGKLYQFEHFGVSVYERAPKDKDKISKFAFIVSTKIAKLAVDRNRIRRMFSEAVRFESTRIVNGYDIVFLAKTTIARQPTNVIMQDTKAALAKLNLIK